MDCILCVEDLHKTYKDIKAVDGVSFELERGGLIGLLGPNGAGKSTTISIISTLIKPDKNSGGVFFEGENITYNPKLIQRSLGVVPQEIALYNQLSGMDNLKFWGSAYGLKKDELQKRISIVSEIIGIDKRLESKVHTYSGGMKRRLNIGVALLHNPKIIIMDEPTVGVDPQSRNHILKTVKELNDNGVSVIYTSHYMEEVEVLCRTIHIMDEGKIIASGTKQELVDNMPVDWEIPEGSEYVTRPNLEDVFLELTGRELRD